MKKIIVLLSVLSSPLFAACEGDTYNYFDFWVGKWQVHTKAGKLAGHNTITKDYDNCVIKENYVATSKYRGESLNIYERGVKQWHQTWVDNTGLLLSLNGTWNGTSMVLKGKQKLEKGNLIHRITWTPVSPEEVHQVWDVSKDSGKSWTNSFYGIYTPVK